MQHSILGRSTFELEGKQLHCSFRDARGPQEVALFLAEIDPNYRTVTRSFPLLWQIPFGLMVGCIMFSVFLGRLDSAWSLLVSYPLILAVMFLWATVKALPARDFILFNDINGNQAFQIVREKAQGEELDAFVAQLQSHIVAVQSDCHPPPIVEEKRSSVTYSDGDSKLSPFGDRWVFSIIAGLFTLSTAIAAEGHPEFSGISFMFLFAGIVISVVLAGLSFTRKERNRWWSLLGILLVVLPFIFFEIDWKTIPFEGPPSWTQRP